MQVTTNFKPICWGKGRCFLMNPNPGSAPQHQIRSQRQSFRWRRIDLFLCRKRGGSSPQWANALKTVCLTLKWAVKFYSNTLKRAWSAHGHCSLKKFFFHLFYLVALSLGYSMSALVLWPGIEPRPPPLAAQSLSHCTTRESPWTLFWVVGGGCAER